MLVDLIPRLTVNPAEYVGTLAIRVHTDDRPECGIIADRHEGFTNNERGHRSPCVVTPNSEGSGFYDFLLDRPEARAGEHQSIRYNYLVTGWDFGGGYPDIWLVLLQELRDEGVGTWDVSLRRPGSHGLTVVLPDYQPGWIARTGTTVIGAR